MPAAHTRPVGPRLNGDYETCAMRFIETLLAGAYLIEIEEHRDERGFFARSFCAREFAAHGIELSRRAWLRTEIEKLAEGKLDLASVQGLQWAPLSERALGLSPKQFWALVATKPERVLH